jgi:hypothetical protein
MANNKQPLQPNSKGVSKGRNPATFWSPGQSASSGGGGGSKTPYQPKGGSTRKPTAANTPKAPTAKVSTKTVGGGSGKGIKIPGLKAK